MEKLILSLFALTAMSGSAFAISDYARIGQTTGGVDCSWANGPSTYRYVPEKGDYYLNTGPDFTPGVGEPICNDPYVGNTYVGDPLAVEDNSYDVNNVLDENRYDYVSPNDSRFSPKRWAGPCEDGRQGRQSHLRRLTAE
jgi:hypothetical protein